jgi:hypothetical protein
MLRNKKNKKYILKDINLEGIYFYLWFSHVKIKVGDKNEFSKQMARL